MPSWLMALLNPTGGLIQTIASFIPNPEERAKAQMQLNSQIVTAYLAADSDQREINKVEAASGSMFVAGWRPACGWLCVFTLAWSWVIAPLISWIVQLSNSHIPALPTLNNEEAQTLLYALLGIGSLRTIDKVIPGGLTQKVTGLFKK